MSDAKCGECGHYNVMVMSNDESTVYCSRCGVSEKADMDS